MFRIDPRDEADLLWFYNDAPTEVGRMRSLQSSFEWQMERKAKQGRQRPRVVYKRSATGRGFTTAWKDEGLRCGPIFVGAGDDRAEPTTELDGRAIAAAARERRIREALRSAGPEVEHALRLRFREVLPEYRIPFGCSGLTAWMRHENRAPLQETVARHRLRGAGALAHLTPTALEIWRRHTPGSVDGFGRWVLSGRAQPWELDRAAQLRREAEGLVLRAYCEYRGEVMEQIARRAA